MTQAPPPSPLLFAGRRKPGATAPPALTPESSAPMKRTRRPEVRRPSRKGPPYHLLLSLEPNPDATDRVLAELEHWLREKHGGDPSLATSTELTFSDARVTIAHRPDSSDGHAFRFRHEHHTALGTWTTAVAMCSSPRTDGWLVVETSSQDGNTAAKPRFIDALLEVLDLKDGDYPLSASARLVSDEEDVEALVEAVCDPDRQGLLFVAGTYADSELSLESFRRRLDKWTQRVRGLAQAVILTPLATQAFNDAMGETHGIDPGTVRTYYPNADPAVSLDAKRHRILSERRIIDSSDDELRSILVPKSQRLVSSRRYPSHVTQVMRALTRIEDRLFVSGLQGGEAVVNVDAQPIVLEATADDALREMPVESPLPSEVDEASIQEAVEEVIEQTGSIEAAAETLAEETTGYLELLEVLAVTLDLKGDLSAAGVAEAITRRVEEARTEGRQQAQGDRRAGESSRLESMQARLDGRQERLEVLEDELNAAEQALDDMALENAIIETERQKRAAEAHWLRGQLHEAGAYETAWADVPEDAYISAPDSMADLAEAIDALNEHGIYFSGDRDITADLMDQDSLDTMVAVAWEVVLVMADYVRAKKDGAFDGGLKAYLVSPPNGYRTTTTERFGERESKGDMQQYGHLRVFPLPHEVRGETTAAMEMHWKLPRCGMVTPRMHFLDSTGVDGNVYIGYCGPHLRSRRTN